MNKQDIDNKFDEINKETVMETKFVLVGNFSEATLDENKRTAEVTVIRKGWSLNGFYYTDKALESIANFLNTSAKQVFLNHNKRSEIFESRIADNHIADNLGAAVSEDGQTVVAKAKFFKSGPNAWVFDRMLESTEGFGPSIVGKAKVKKGTAEGRSGAIVEDVIWLHSYDMVVKPSAGGTINKVTESLAVSNGYVHIYESFNTDIEQDFLLEASGGVMKPKVTPSTLKAKIDQKEERREAQSKYWDLEYAFTSELGDIVLARGEYEYLSIAERKKLIEPLLSDFSTEVSKLKLVTPRPLPVTTKEQITNMEITETSTSIRIKVNSGSFSKGFKKVVVSKENGITALVGKNKKDSMEVQSYEFTTAKGWTTELANKWISDNIKTKENMKEGVDMEIKSLNDLKTNHPDLYTALITEAQNDADAKIKVEGWRTDSENLVESTKELDTLKAEIVTLKEAQTSKETEVKSLVESVDNYKVKEMAVKKKELILTVKKEAELSEDNCSESFNTLLESFEFDSEKEEEFTTLIKEHIEDRKAITAKLPKGTKPIVEGVGNAVKKVAESTSNIPDNEKAAKLILAAM